MVLRINKHSSSRFSINQNLAPGASRGVLGALCIWFLWLPASISSCAVADLFELYQGGQVVGKEVERSPNGGYVIRTPAGARISLAKSQIKRIVRQSDDLFEYHRRSRALADTVDAHRKLADWCQEHGLREQTGHHLQQILQLDPSDEPARLSLGYQRVGEHWMTREEIMQSRGLRFHDGTYRTPQDIALREREKQRKASETKWFTNMKRWRGWLVGRREDRAREAEAEISAINDPLAAPALVKFLDQEQNLSIRELLTATLAQLDHSLATQKLIELSLDDPDPEVRLQCLEYLTRSGRPVSLTPYVRALKHKDNVLVNRAGEALQEIGNPAAISPLINALVTTHKYQVGEGSPGQIDASFSPRGSRGGGGGGLSFGGGGPKFEKIAQENLHVLRALIKLSDGENFGYDEEAWRHWLVNRSNRLQFDARRDE